VTLAVPTPIERLARTRNTRRTGSRVTAAVVVMLLAGCSQDDQRAGQDRAATSTTPASAVPTTAATTTTVAVPGIAPGAQCVTGEDGASEVWLAAADGVPLGALSLGAGTDGVVLLHEGEGDVCNWLPIGRRLRDEGYRVLLLDARWHGSSGQPYNNVYRWDLDVVAAVEYLRGDGVEHLVLAGGSAGASTVTAVAPELNPPPVGVVNASGGYSWRSFDIRDVAPRLTMPILFMAADADRTFAEQAQDLAGMVATTDSQVVVVPGTAHGAEMFEGDSAQQAYEALLAFLARVTQH
jgi:pimeloyl-ACP methyl ester carboxylesterase